MPETSSGVERFAGEVAEILEADDGVVHPESLLVGDLDFDSLAFVELSILLMERYGSRNFLAAVSDEIDASALTVGSVYENYAR